jgi:hypothetical protein
VLITAATASACSAISWDVGTELAAAERAVRAGPGVRIGEIGGDEPDRIGGVRKMRVFATGWEILKLLFREYRLMKRA